MCNFEVISSLSCAAQKKPFAPAQKEALSDEIPCDQHRERSANQ